MTIATVARTMAEQGKLCPECTHPWGRHVPDTGCAARTLTNGSRRLVRCDCMERPDVIPSWTEPPRGGKHATPAEIDDSPASAGMSE